MLGIFPGGIRLADAAFELDTESANKQIRQQKRELSHDFLDVRLWRASVGPCKTHARLDDFCAGSVSRVA